MITLSSLHLTVIFLSNLINFNFIQSYKHIMLSSCPIFSSTFNKKQTNIINIVIKL